jgi:hypothetical protein
MSACTTLQDRYIHADDECASARQPIVTAGDELNRRQRQMAEAIANQQMVGRERPTVTQYGNNVQINFGNILQNEIERETYAAQAYQAIKASESGGNAVAILASIQGDARSQQEALDLVARTIRGLRDCRRRQVAAIRQTVGTGTVTDASAPARIARQQTLLAEDDQLANEVFGYYAQRTTVIADAARNYGNGYSGSDRFRPARGRAPRPSTNAVETMVRQQRLLQETDKRDSDAIHAELNNTSTAARHAG